MKIRDFRRGVWLYAPNYNIPALFAPLAVLLLAVFTRFYHLDTQSLWNDEGNSLRLAQRSVGDLIDAAGHDIHPPGYYLLLKAWIGVAGESEFSLRALSALQGVLTVAITMVLGRVLFARAAGLIAGLLVALSPFAVYYSQETRMYAQLALLSTASMWVFVVWIKRVSALGGSQTRLYTNWRVALSLALLNAAGLYTQYSYPFTMLAQGVLFGVWIGNPPLQKRVIRRAIFEYAALNLLTLVLFALWLPTAWDQVTNWPRTGVNLALSGQARTIWTWITYGNTAGQVVWWSFAWPGLLILAALALPDRHRPPYGWRVGLPLVWGGIVSGALLVSGAYREANLKFLLPAQIAAALLIGCGVWRLWVTTGPVLRVTSLKMSYIRRVLAGVCLFLLVIGQLEALEALYTYPAYARPDYRAMVAQILADPRPGDAIILDAPNQWEVFTYYYDGGAPVYPLPRGLGGDDAQTRNEVLGVLAAHDRVFVLFWGEEERDPNRIVQATLDAEAYPVASQWYGDVRLVVYAVLDKSPTEPDAVSGARFGDYITLTGFALSANSLRPGDVLGVTLFWTTDAPLETRYKVTVQLLAPDGSLVYQHDGEPGNNRVLTTTWEPGKTVIDSHGLVVPPDLAPGTYTVIVGLYDINAPLDRLPVSMGGKGVGDTLPFAGLKIGE